MSTRGKVNDKFNDLAYLPLRLCFTCRSCHSCLNESAYHRHSSPLSFLIFAGRCTTCLPVTLYLQYQKKPVVRSLSRTLLWKSLLSTTEEPDTRSLKAAKRRFLQQNLEICQRCRNSKLLSNCR
ncbi:hypothetical protein AB4K20DRAFT_1411778 [Rhizopus microsporus]